MNSVQFSHSVMSDSATPWTTGFQASLSITKYQSLPKLMSFESVMPSNHLILCHPLLLLPSIFPSIRVFWNESALHIRWPKYCSFSFSISPSNEHPELISFRMDWLDLLVVQGTLKSLLQHHRATLEALEKWLSYTYTYIPQKEMATHSSIWATSCEELTHWKRPWCWEELGAGGEADDRGSEGWMASLTGWTWVSVNSWSWWWTGRPGMLRFMGSQRVWYDWVTDLIWSDIYISFLPVSLSMDI